MDQRTIQILFALLRSAICGSKLTEQERKSYSPDMLEYLLEVSSKHDIDHLVVLGLKTNHLLPTDKPELEKRILTAAYRYELMKYEYETLCKALERAQIRFMPLKGSVIRKYYPEEWMRTSCDIDILVREEDLQKTRSFLTEQLKYTAEWQGSHDISMFSENGVHLELHYELVEYIIANSASKILQKVWDVSEAREGSTCQYEMPDEMFYFYHVAHMAKHLQQGGCGIRPFIDLWLLDNIAEADKEKREKLLKSGGLLDFSRCASNLSAVWFADGTMDETSRKLQGYILSGGVYGTEKNRILLQQQKKGGRLRYALSKIFIPYDVIKFHYPILQKHRWLTPIMQVRRWFKLVFCGHARRTLRELSYNATVSKTQAAEMKTFLDEIGL